MRFPPWHDFFSLDAGALKTEALAWLLALVKDPEEKIRRYAMAALPKLGSGEAEEKQRLTLANQAVSARETQFLAKTLECIGGSETLNAGINALPHPSPSIRRGSKPTSRAARAKTAFPWKPFSLSLRASESHG